MMVAMKVAAPHCFREYSSEWYAEPQARDVMQHMRFGHWTDRHYEAHLRMRRSNFEELCNLLRPRWGGLLHACMLVLHAIGLVCMQGQYSIVPPDSTRPL